MAQEKLKEWQVPPSTADDSAKLKWIDEATEDGQLWNRSQRGTKDLRKSLDLFAGNENSQDDPVYRSTLDTGRLRRNCREIVGALSNIRPIWGYNSDNAAFKPFAQQMNLTTRAIYLEGFFDRKIKEALWWATATCTGWLYPLFTRKMAGTGKSGIELRAYGSPSVLPVQVPNTNDFGESYAVTLLDEVPVYMAHSMFPEHQDQLNPTKSMYWYASEIRDASNRNLMQRIFSRTKRSGKSNDLVGIRRTWVNDLSVNTSGVPIYMGEWGVDDITHQPVALTTWSYRVPFEGEDIPAGRDARGNTLHRKATRDDARIYPNRRLLISGEKCVTYDGPAFDWHGDLPLINISVDSTPWEPLGFSLIKDGYEAQRQINKVWRGVVQKVMAELDPALGYDINAVPKKQADSFDPWQPRARQGFDGSMVEKPFTTILPDAMYKVSGEVMALMTEKFPEMMDYQTGVNQVIALAKARAMSGKLDEGALEKLSEGPIVMDISRDMEGQLTRMGYQVGYLELQWLTSKRVMQYVGEDNVSIETFDYDPTRIIPSHGPDEIHRPDGTMPDSIYSPMQRAKQFADSLRFSIQPYSLHEITQTTNQLKLLQLRKAGVGIDDETLAERFNLFNYGHIDGTTIREKYKQQQEEQVEFMFRLKKIADSLGLGDMMPGGKSTAPGTAANPQPEGRPPSYNASPELQQKDGGARSTIATSK